MSETEINVDGVLLFASALYDIGLDEDACKFAGNYLPNLAQFGINAENDITKERIYNLVGREADGSVKPEYRHMLHAKDDRIENAVFNIYYRGNNFAARASYDLLCKAATDGNADAYYYMGRMYLGSGYIPQCITFEYDLEKGEHYFNVSMQKGSALAMFACRRLSGFEPENGSFVNPPFDTQTEVFRAVYFNAIAGDVFYQYVLANAYYFGDVFELLDIPDTDYLANLSARVALNLYEEQLSAGYRMGEGNYIDILTSGDCGIKPDKKRIKRFGKKADKARKIRFKQLRKSL